MKKSFRVLLSIILCFLLISAVFVFTSCDEADKDDSSKSEEKEEKEEKDEKDEKGTGDSQKDDKEDSTGGEDATDGEDSTDDEKVTDGEEESNFASVVVLRNDVAAGARITSRDVEMAEIAKDQLPDGYITNKIDAIGLFAKQALAKGDVIVGSMLVETPDSDQTPGGDENPDSGIAPDDIIPPPDGGIDRPVAVDRGYVIITDYVEVNSGKDVAQAIQKVIDENPRKTIYFPDGEYLISKPIETSANPERAVSLSLSNFAVIKAAEGWESSEAMIRLGGKENCNNIHIPGSNYFLEGGCIDGSMVANGVSIDSGRETAIRNLSIKRTQIGINIKSGANSGSSDADISNVNIVGNAMPNSIGVLITGYDNTLTNMRIAAVQTGVKLVGAGNFLRNIHPLYIYAGELHSKDPEHYDGVEHIDYSQSVAFYEESNNNWYDICYSDQFAVGFRIGNGSTSLFNSCFCLWYSNNGNKEIGFQAAGAFNAMIVNSRVSFRGGVANTAFLQEGASGGNGVILYPIFSESNCADKSYQKYLAGKVR